MRKIPRISTVILVALGASPTGAHHSGYVYQSTPIWITGTVVAFERIDPHTLITVEERHDDGQVRRWAVEGPGRSQVERRSAETIVPQVGETIEFCAFPYKPLEELVRIFPEMTAAGRGSAIVDGASPQLVAGHVMVTANGVKQLWEPHGLISECIRSSADSRESWVDFLAANASVVQAWCQQTNYEHVRVTASLQALVAQINALLDDPC